jgi:hypothetical protein
MAEPTYYASVIASVAGANKRHLTIWNGHASVVVRVYGIRAATASTNAVTGLVIPLTVSRITAAPTGGSNATITKSDSQNPNVPASITITTNDTGGATEAGAVGCGVVSGEETAAAVSDVLFDAPIDGSQPLVLRQNEGIVIRQGALASAGAVSIVAKVGAV